MVKIIEALIQAALLECCNQTFIKKFKENDAYNFVKQKCLEDFAAFLNKDPACNSNPNILIQ
jgi:hypothetical protein